MLFFGVVLATVTLLPSPILASYQTWSSLPSCGKFCISNALGVSFNVGCEWLNISCTCGTVAYLQSLNDCVNKNRILGCGGQTSAVQNDILNYQWFTFCPHANGTLSETIRTSTSTKAQSPSSSQTKSSRLTLSPAAAATLSSSTSIGSPVSTESSTSTSTLSSTTPNSTFATSFTLTSSSSSSSTASLSTSTSTVVVNVTAPASPTTSTSTSDGGSAATFSPVSNTGVHFRGGTNNDMLSRTRSSAVQSTLTLLLLVGAVAILLG